MANNNNDQQSCFKLENSDDFSVDVLKTTIEEICKVKCGFYRQHLMKTLESFEHQSEYVRYLIQLIDVKLLGHQLQLELRQFAAILLKNYCLKYWIEHDLIPNEQKRLIKDLLIRYFYDFQPKITIQLFHITAKLSRILWPNQWPELIPTLLGIIEQENSEDFLQSFQGISCLHEVFFELFYKYQFLDNSAGAGGNTNLFRSLAIQLFPILLKLWAKQSKILQQYLNSFVTHMNGCIISHQNSSYGSQTCPFLTQVPNSDPLIELRFYYVIILSKFLKSILDIAFEDLYSNCALFKNFWKTFLGCIILFSSFIKQIRPTYVYLLQYECLSPQLVEEFQCLQRHECPKGGVQPHMMTMYLKFNGHKTTVDGTRKSCDGFSEQKEDNVPSQSEPKSQQQEQQSIGCNRAASSSRIFDFEDFNYLHDDSSNYVDASILENKQYTFFIKIVSFVMKLLKILNFSPIIIQKKYPIQCIPMLECLLHFYYKHLIEEYSMSNNNSNNSGGNNFGGTSISMDNNESVTEGNKHLPLKCLTTAAVMFLSGVLSCPAYSVSNLYEQHPSGVNNNESNSMDTCMSKFSVQHAYSLIHTFFNEERALALVERLVHHELLSFANTELTIWHEDAEKFYSLLQSESVDSQYFSLRIYSEKLYVQLLDISPDVVAKYVLNTFLMKSREFLQSDTFEEKVGRDIKDIVLWENLYNTMTLNVSVLLKYLPFTPTEWLLQFVGPFFQYILANQAQYTKYVAHGLPILSIRMLQVIIAWRSEFAFLTYPVIMEFLCFLLRHSASSVEFFLTSDSSNPSEPSKRKSCSTAQRPCRRTKTNADDKANSEEDGDLGVLLYTIKAVHCLINEINFPTNILLPHAKVIIHTFCRVLLSLEESETKQSILETIQDLVTVVKMEHYNNIVIHSNNNANYNHSQTANRITASEDYNEEYFSHLYAQITDIFAVTWSQLSTDDVIVGAFLSMVTETVRLIDGHINHPHSLLSLLSILRSSLSNRILINDSMMLCMTIHRHFHAKQCNKEFLDRLVEETVSCIDIFTSIYHSSLRSDVSSTITDNSCSPPLCCLLLEASMLQCGHRLLLDNKYLELVHVLVPLLFHPPLTLANNPAPSSFSNSNPGFGINCTATGTENCHYTYLVRFLEAWIYRNPIQVAEFLTTSGCLTTAVKISGSICQCPNLSRLLSPYQRSSPAVVACMQLVLRLLLITPQYVINAFTRLKEEIVAYIHEHFAASQCAVNLTEEILINEFVQNTFTIFNYLEEEECIFSMRLWCIALWSFIPPDNNSTTLLPCLCPLSSNTIAKWLPKILEITYSVSAQFRQILQHSRAESTEALLWYHVKMLVRDPTGEEIPPPESFESNRQSVSESNLNTDILLQQILTCNEEQAILGSLSVLAKGNSVVQTTVTREEIVQEFLHFLASDGMMNVSLKAIFEERLATMRILLGGTQSQQLHQLPASPCR